MDISLALGCGGLKGIAHIGVIRSLERAGFVIRAIAGTSAGGLIGAVYASGYSPDQIAEIIASMDQNHMFARGKGEGPGLLGLSGLTSTLAKCVGDRSFTDLRIPFACTAVDINTDQEIILTRGNVLDAMLATLAIPGVFPPRQIGAFNLVDGSVLDPVPVALARWLAPKIPVIAVCLSPAPERWATLPTTTLPISGNPFTQPIIDQISRMRLGLAFQIFLRSQDITSRMMAELRMSIDKPDVIIRPDLDEFGILGSVNPKELEKRGEIAADKALPHIMKALGWRNQMLRRFQRSSAPGKVFDPAGESPRPSGEEGSA